MRAVLKPGLALSLLLAAAPCLAEEAKPAPSLEALQARIDALQGELDALKRQLPKATPSWKGAPELADPDKGWSFKPRGRLQFDAGHVGVPGDYAASRNLGFNARARRLRLGVEGTMPGGFGYKAEVDFANGSVSVTDAYLSYGAAGSPVSVRVGNINTLGGLDEITSSNHISFAERGQMSEAFLHGRRIGVAVAAQHDDLRAEAGLFAAHGVDASFDNDGWIAAARVTWSPEVAGGRLHLGLNAQLRDFASNNGGAAQAGNGTVSSGQLARYRARPFSQLTDVRFVDTGNFAAHGDLILGAELGGVFGSLYFASEAQWMRVDAYAPGDIRSGLDSFAGGNVAVVPTGNPGFLSAYGELGWFITGETRGYKDGIWARTKVLKPLGRAGGTGAFQLAARIDHLDLDSNKLKGGLTNNFTTGLTSLDAPAIRLARGGRQTGYLLGLNWVPIDYVRLMLSYARVTVEGGPLAALVRPLSALPVDERSYATDVLAARMQVEF